MEQQAKERLTGAVILVALLVLLVPELLTGPRSTLPPAAAQPDQAPMRAYTMDLGEAHPNSAPVAASTAAPAAREPATPASAPEPAQTQQAPVTVVPAPAPPVAQPVVTPTPAVHPPVAPAPRATQHSAAAWTVQLGTFSNRDNAARLVARLKSQGFSASIAETTAKNGHNMFRVRVGTAKDRATAQKLLGRLRAAGEKGGEVVPR